MLSPEALRERKWGRFPTLRKALEEKRLPDTYYGVSSTSDNLCEQYRRLIEIALLTNEHEQLVMDTAQVTGREHMCRDLDELRRQLEHASMFFREHVGRVEKLCSQL